MFSHAVLCRLPNLESAADLLNAVHSCRLVGYDRAANPSGADSGH
jgi:hypothetical protein